MEVRIEEVDVIILPKLMTKALKGVKFPREIIKRDKNKTSYVCTTVYNFQNIFSYLF